MNNVSNGAKGMINSIYPGQNASLISHVLPRPVCPNTSDHYSTWKMKIEKKKKKKLEKALFYLVLSGIEIRVLR